ncbi:shiftless antiviral inhibitor of ribosomal frameshifting protein homolog [Hypomesus transpacificus]|uniref:shiftless antiviral inhibitor of ribosomal frameshifting protein homolog n=1 Tax=Hypomesus transpacificus TaxID=137520 RepID=UPI001F084BD8|nr:shiftless antiviral inhibitor of ribosomal frameshifting protein homolog [Hypomesus transpacificus]
MNVEVELEKNVRRFREKFHGKVAIDKATILMRRYLNNHHMVTMEVILMKDRDLDDEDRRCLHKDLAVKNVVERLTAEERQQAPPLVSPAQPRADRRPKEDEDIKELGQRLQVLPLTEKNKRMFDNAQRNLTPSAVHQFACQACDKDWWRRVPLRKRVSRCHLCKQKYDPVPQNRMWGIGQFNCLVCARVFRGFGRMDLGSPCYRCRSLVIPSEILPPLQGRVGEPGKARNPHSCLAEDCYNRQEPHVPGTECVHPRSRQVNRKPRVVNPSPSHDSSGSTVNTCLSQGSLDNLYDLIMDDIKEESDDESRGGRSHGSGSDSS